MSDETPNTLQKAVAAVMAEVERLKKADSNAFAKYRYTSVDDFKDALRPLLAKHGLSLRISETSCTLTEVKGEKKDSTVATFALQITLEHSSGAASEPDNITVMLPFVGAQTTGQARSYAVKEWLKGRFLASSGDTAEDDPDYNAEELSKAAARDIYGKLRDELRDAVKNGKKAMEEWASTRAPSIAILPNDWRISLRAEYKEALATGKAPPKQEPDEPSETFEADARALDEEFAGVVGPRVKPDFSKLETVE